MLKDFRNFIMRGNVVDLAVGVVIGAAFNNLVSSFTAAFLDPIIRLTGGGEVAGAIILRAASNGQDAIVLDWGSFITTLINFIITAAVLFFFVVKPVSSINKRFTKEEKTAPPEPSNEEKLLIEIRDELKKR